MSDAVPEIAVVVATRDRADRLHALLEGLSAQTLGRRRFEIVIVDDCSRDGTPGVLGAAADRLPLTVLRQDAAGGPAAARNRGWDAARAALIAFTDDDCVPEPAWLEALLAAAHANPGAIVQGRTAPNPAEADRLGPFAKTVDIDAPTPHFETCNIAYPRALLEAVGGFDEAYPAAAGEDSDLGWRSVDEGATAVFAADAVVHHAVFDRGPIAALQGALMARHGVQAYKRNPALRAHLTQGVFYERSHPLLLQAALGLWLARRQPAAAAFALPYALHLRSRCVRKRAGLAAMPYFALYDAIQVGATAVGAVQHRFPVI